MATRAKRLSVPKRPDYGQGIYRRCIVLESGDGEVRGELADDFHHFGVRLVHDGQRVLAAEGEDVRVPWTTCPGAVEPLRRMQGARISDLILEAFGHTRAREQCTHLHDLACLAVTHAASGEASRRYDISVSDRVDDASEAILLRDGEELLRWRVRGNAVERGTPQSFTGTPLASFAFLEFLIEMRSEPGHDPSVAQAACALQRAIFVSGGRRHQFRAFATAADVASVVGPACHTFRPSRVSEAKRIRGSGRDFTHAPEKVLDRD